MTRYTRYIAGPEDDAWDTEGAENLTVAEILAVLAEDGLTLARHVGGCADGPEPCNRWHAIRTAGYAADEGAQRDVS